MRVSVGWRLEWRKIKAFKLILQLTTEAAVHSIYPQCRESSLMSVLCWCWRWECASVCVCPRKIYLCVAYNMPTFTMWYGKKKYNSIISDFCWCLRSVWRSFQTDVVLNAASTWPWTVILAAVVALYFLTQRYWLSTNAWWGHQWSPTSCLFFIV